MLKAEALGVNGFLHVLITSSYTMFVAKWGKIGTTSISEFHGIHIYGAYIVVKARVDKLRSFQASHITDEYRHN
jgi:hypothetical protein